MQKRSYTKVGIILLAAVIMGFVAMPPESKQNFPFAKSIHEKHLSCIGQETSSPDCFLAQFGEGIFYSKINLGLDLQGGSQLDYKIDLRKVPANEKQQIVDGILSVITKRVNGLGVAEPNIYTSDIGDEKHLIVELAGIKDLEQAKQIVGKTIQLEFKEQKENPAMDPKEKEEIKASAQTLLNKVLSGGDIGVLGQEEQLSNSGKIAYIESNKLQFKDEVPGLIAENLFSLNAGQTFKEVIDTGSGYSVIKVTEKNETEREVKTPKQTLIQHILIAYKGAESAPENITRTSEEAQKLATEIKGKLGTGAKFEDLAAQYSDDPGSKNNGGKYEKAVIEGDTTYVKEFSDASLALKTGEISAPVKTVFGYHIIKSITSSEAKTEKKLEPQIKYIQVYYDAQPDPWKETALNGQHFVHADVEFTQMYQPYVSIQFNDEGAKLFEEITGRNVNKPVAIFVGGQLKSAPNVNEKISGGRAQISGRFTIDEANELARDLNTGAIPAPIILAGQYSIGASLGQDALSKSVNAGLIGFLLVTVFMILYYRLPGFLASLALGVYCAILIFLLKIAIPLIWALIISIAVFGFLITVILKNRDSAPEKAISLILASFILFFLTFLLSTSVVLTLAGIAGVVLSIGMAVDANILIFERVKEELRDGRSLGAAIEVGFDRAWNSIRDSNFSSLITCAILFYFGSSIIQGFAFNLAAGILVSMFTAITITKTFLGAMVNTRIAEKIWLFGNPKKKEKKPLPIVQNRKIVYIISAVLLIVSLLGIPLFGVKAGLDFTGGTLMEFKFTNKQITVDQLKEVLAKSSEIVNQSKATSETTGTQVLNTSTAKDITLESSDPKLELGKAHIVPSQDGFIIKTAHISNTAHDRVKEEIKKLLGEFEEIRYSTVGPTVGSSMQYKAIMAVIIASAMIVIYIAFAFRRVPKHVGKWRFGVTAIIALIHDLGIMLGVYVYLGAIVGVEVDALFITALLTILGFSVHDTIVVFDRIREKLKYQKKDETFEEIANQAVNETIARSINTSLSVALSLLALALFGAESIRYFVISLLIGVISGTYSSIFVATPLLVDWQNYVRNKKKKN